MASPNTIWAGTLSLQNPARTPFILDRFGRCRNLRYIEFHVRNFLVLRELAPSSNPWNSYQLAES